MPHLVKKNSFFAGVDANLNLLSVTTKYLGEASFIGQGAGSLPTGHAIVQDLEDLLDRDFEIKRRKRKAKLNNDIYGRWLIVHKNIPVFEGYTAEQLSDDTIVTKHCYLRDIMKILNRYEDDRMFIGEIEDD